jgi:hypothetical protein
MKNDCKKQRGRRNQKGGMMILFRMGCTYVQIYNSIIYLTKAKVRQIQFKKNDLGQELTLPYQDGSGEGSGAIQVP